MKKNFYVLFTVFVSLLPISIFAATNELIVDCTKEIKPGDNIVCELSASTLSYVSSMEIPFSLSSGMSAISIALADNRMFGNSVVGNKLAIALAEDIVGNFKIGTLKLSTASDIAIGYANITFNNIIFKDNNFERIQIPDVSKSVLVKGTESGSSGGNNNLPSTGSGSSSNGGKNSNSNIKKDNNDVSHDDQSIADNHVEDLNTNDLKKTFLVDILIDNYEIDFLQDVFEYKLKIKNEDKLVISPVLENISLKYEIFGNENLKDGSVIEIKVTDGINEQTYKILIEKASTKIITTVIFACIVIFLIVINVIRIINNKKTAANVEV